MDIPPVLVLASEMVGSNQDNKPLFWSKMSFNNLRTVIYRIYSCLTLPWHIIRAMDLWYLVRVIESFIRHQNIFIPDRVKYFVSLEGWAHGSISRCFGICFWNMLRLNVLLQPGDAAVVSRQYVCSFYAQRIHRKEVHCESGKDCWLSGELGLAYSDSIWKVY